tara:strand:- start:713 stop:1639 length:927 start_codon:yes stop_codon:yes gene_type:complete
MSTNNTISNDGIKVKLSIAVWNPRVQDKQAAAERAKAKDANVTQHKHHVVLVDAADVKPLKDIENSARASFSRLVSAPWVEYTPDPDVEVKPSLRGCYYFLSTTYLSEYLDTMARFRQEFNAARQEFIDNYPTLLQKQATSAGVGLADFAKFRHRYPSADRVGERISLTTYEDSIVTSLLPDVVDERIKEELKKLNERKAVQVDHGFRAVTTHVKQDLIETAAHVGSMCTKKNESTSSPITATVVERLVDKLETAQLKAPRHDADLDEAILIGKSIMDDLDADILKANEASRNKVIAGSNRMKDLIKL